MTVHRRIKHSIAAFSCLSVGALGLAFVAGPAAAALPADLVTFATPGSYTWVVPTGVTSVEVVAEGGEGAASVGYSTVAGGDGGRQTATVGVTPGETLTVVVGGGATNESGGFNGGGTGNTGTTAGGGGGASDVRQGGSTLADRVVVAGGGGGAGRTGPGSIGGTGGQGGGTAGSDAASTSFGTIGAGGGAGTASAGGLAGTNNGAGVGHVGTFGIGGDGGAGNESGGSGGGGWYGGGGASPGSWRGGGGGGGGSNYAIPAATSVLSENGVNAGDGSVVLSWTPAPTTTTTTTTAPPASAPTTTAAPAAPKSTCPTWAIRVNKDTFWAVNLLRWVCGYQISKLRSGSKTVTYVVPFGWKWQWTVNPRFR